MLHDIMFLEYLITYQSGELRNFYRGKKNKKTNHQAYAYTVCSLYTVCASVTLRTSRFDCRKSLPS
jgi:hypothetical protein